MGRRKPPPTGVLPHQEVRRLCRQGVISQWAEPNIRSAGYDLRVGEEFYFAPEVNGKVRVSRLVPGKRETIVVPSNGLVIVTMREELDLGPDLVGHLSLKLNFLLRGLIMANQSQVDAGYKGQIWALLYNLSQSPVSLQRGDSILRLELVRLAHATTKPYEEGYEGLTLAGALKEPVDSSLRAMQEEVEKSSRRVTITQWVAISVGVALTILAGYLTYFGRMSDVEQRISRLEGRAQETQPIDAELARQRSEVASLRRELERLRRLVQQPGE